MTRSRVCYRGFLWACLAESATGRREGAGRDGRRDQDKTRHKPEKPEKKKTTTTPREEEEETSATGE